MPQFILKIEMENMIPDPELRNRRIALYLHDTFIDMQKNNFKEICGDIRNISGSVVGHYEVIP